MEVAHEHGRNPQELPQNCISHILSFATPRDICRLSAVSKDFRSAATNDSVWDKFLPHDHILRRAVAPFPPSSKKQLYFHLCDSILIDEGRKRLFLERSTGKIGYVLSATELSIAWGDDRRYWRWVSRYDSRFEELAELIQVCWLDLSGEMDCTVLSVGTVYRVLFLLKFGRRWTYGWARPIEFSVTTPEGEEVESEEVLMEVNEGSQRLYGGEWMQAVGNDGWMEGWTEVFAGEFRVTTDSSHIEFCMRETKSNRWKGGVLVDGVRIEPKI